MKTKLFPITIIYYIYNFTFLQFYAGYRYYRIILRWIFRKLEGVMGDWMELAQDRDRWRALLGTVRDFRFP
jgi:hypothetical protein